MDGRDKLHACMKFIGHPQNREMLGAAEWNRAERGRASHAHCRAISAHIRQSGPESGSGFQVKVLKTFYVVPFSLGSGLGSAHHPASSG